MRCLFRISKSEGAIYKSEGAINKCEGAKQRGNISYTPLQYHHVSLTDPTYGYYQRKKSPPLLIAGASNVFSEKPSGS